MPQHDDQDDLAALDFSAHDSGSAGSDVADSDALDFSVADECGAESPADAFDDYLPAEPDDAHTELEVIASVAEVEEEDESEEDGSQQFAVTNPADTVSVSALMDGRTHRVELSAKATNMTESELAEEILVLAELARQKGLAGQRTYLSENAFQFEGVQELGEIGLDGNELLREFLDTGMQLPTPEQAEAAQAEVFATRYTAEK